MMLLFALINLHDDTAPATHAMGPLTAGVIALFAIAAVIVVATYRRRARGGRSGGYLPRRGTSAVLLGAICAVVLVLVSTSAQPIPSLTIVSHAGRAQSSRPARHLQPASPARVSAIERSASRPVTGAFADRIGGALLRRRCPVTVSSVARALRLPSS
jgi:hypothetical protein